MAIIGGLEAYALSRGVDGVAFGGAVAAISFIVGACLTGKINPLNGGRSDAN